MKRTSKTLAAVGATLLMSSFGLASTTMAQDGGPNDNNPSDIASESRAASFPAPGPMETSFVPVKPCRLFDTREAGGAMGNAATRDFSVKGALAGQGGAANCDIPEGATAASINLTAIAQSGTSGFVRGWAAGGAQVTSTLLNFSPALNASNSVEVPLCEGACANDITLKTFGSAHLVGEVLGYFVPPIHASVSANGIIQGGSPRVIGSERISRGHYIVKVDRDLTNCTVAGTSEYAGYNAEASVFVFGPSVPNDEVVVFTTNPDGLRKDVPFSLLVSC